MIALDLFNLILSPFFVTYFEAQMSIFDYFQMYQKTDSAKVWANGLSILQLLLFVVGFFVTRASETKSSFYLRWMVTITNFAIWICLVVIPLVVMAIIGVTSYRHGF